MYSHSSLHSNSLVSGRATPPPRVVFPAPCAAPKEGGLLTIPVCLAMLISDLNLLRVAGPTKSGFRHVSQVFVCKCMCVSVCVRVCVRLIYISVTFGSMHRRLGVETERSADPYRESKLSTQHPAPHASHARQDRSMVRNRLVAGANLGGFSYSSSVSRNYAPSCC